MGKRKLVIDVEIEGGETGSRNKKISVDKCSDDIELIEKIPNNGIHISREDISSCDVQSRRSSRLKEKLKSTVIEIMDDNIPNNLNVRSFTTCYGETIDISDDDSEVNVIIGDLCDDDDVEDINVGRNCNNVDKPTEDSVGCKNGNEDSNVIETTTNTGNDDVSNSNMDSNCIKKTIQDNVEITNSEMDISENNINSICNESPDLNQSSSLKLIAENDKNITFRGLNGEQYDIILLGNMALTEEEKTGNSNEHLEANEFINQSKFENSKDEANTTCTIQQMDTSVCTTEFEKELEKIGIFPWTHLSQNMMKSSINSDGEKNSKTQKIDRGIQTWPIATQWQQIIQALEDPRDMVSCDENLIVIKERQPKARFHYLIIPTVNMRDLNELGPSHLGMIEYMEKVAKELIVKPEHSNETFSLGFIGKTSMIMLKKQRFVWIHMHVISKTPNFAYLTKKKEWNTFHSKLFMHLHEVKHMLETTGSVKVPTPEEYNSYLIDDVKCNYCDYTSISMPTLTKHLKKNHVKKL